MWVKLGYERNCGIVLDGLCTVNRCECYPRLIAAQQILIGCSSANVGASTSGSFHPQLRPKKLQNGTILAENVLIMLLYGKDRLSSG